MSVPACRADIDGERLVLAEYLAASGLPPPLLPAPATAAAHEAPCEVLAWAASGGMWLTGHRDGTPRPAPSGFPARVAALTELLAVATHRVGGRVRVDGWELLFGRAGLRRAERNGRISVGGSCRLLPAGDGWVALNLARPDDAELVPALLGAEPGGDPWAAVSAAALSRSAGELAGRAQLLGIPAAALPRSAPEPPVPAAPFTVRRCGTPWDRSGAPFTVVDLTAMWAGPLCAHLLGRAGGRVIKVESPHRPDAARQGDPEFFDWLHHGHAAAVLDLRSPHRVHQLRRLIGGADVVVESSRPRALRQLGIDAEKELAAHPGLVWVSITGYGRDGPGGNLVAFGDDAAVAGGLVARDEHGAPVFCGDAIADPLTGTMAALVAATALTAGGGHLVDVPMAGVAAWAAGAASGPAVQPAEHPVERRAGSCAVRCGGDEALVLPPTGLDGTPGR